MTEHERALLIGLANVVRENLSRDLSDSTRAHDVAALDALLAPFAARVSSLAAQALSGIGRWGEHEPHCARITDLSGKSQCTCGRALATFSFRTSLGVSRAYRPDGIPRRADVRFDTPAEKALRDALRAVESIHGASPGLTRASQLISEAHDLVSDFIETEMARSAPYRHLRSDEPGRIKIDGELIGLPAGELSGLIPGARYVVAFDEIRRVYVAQLESEGEMEWSIIGRITVAE